jgi:hypothetical protein
MEADFSRISFYSVGEEREGGGGMDWSKEKSTN